MLLSILHNEAKSSLEKNDLEHMMRVEVLIIRF